MYPDEPSSARDEIGYACNEERQEVIYHRLGESDDGEMEYFIIAINLSDEPRKVDIPFTFSGTWYELLNEEQPVEMEECWLRRHEIPPNWGRVFVGWR